MLMFQYAKSTHRNDKPLFKSNNNKKAPVSPSGESGEPEFMIKP